MDKKFSADASTVINADAAKVWDALINPELIKLYLFGTNAVSDWKVGSTITYKGVWEGKEYEDKGVIKELELQKYLLTTYWSSFSGMADAPENYQNVAYTLTAAEGGGTKLAIHQDNVPTQQAADHSAQNWKTVLESLKKLLEK